MSGPLKGSRSESIARIARWSLPARSALALVVVVLGLTVRAALDPLVGVTTPFSVFYIGVALVAMLARTIPAVLAALLFALGGDYFYLGRLREFDFTVSTLAAQLVFLSVSAGVISTIHVLRRTRRKLELQAAEVESQRQWFQVTFASIGDGVITTDIHARVSLLNPRAEAMTGWTTEAARGKPVEDIFHIVHEDSRKRVAHLLGPVLSEGKMVGLTNPRLLVAKDGREIPIENNAAPIREPGGRVLGAVIVFQDATERRRSADALRIAESRKSAILDASLDAIITMDHEGAVADFNRAAERIFGHSAAQAIGRPLADLIIPEPYRARHWQGLSRYLATGEAHVFDQRLELSALHADGREFPVELSISRIAGVTPPLFTATLRDITARKKSELTLRAKEEELRAMADSIPQLAWMAEADGNIVWYNRGWFDYTGTTLEQMRGWGWQSVHDPAILPSVIERWQASLRTGATFDMEFPLRGADGVFRWFLTRVNPLRDAQGQVVRWFGTNTDVDEVRRAREALREETRILELLNDTGSAIASKLDLESLVQTVTDAATKLSGAKFGAFFYNDLNDQGESLLLFSLSGAPREAFEKFGMPRNTAVFNPTFQGQGVVRSADITKDPRYGTMAPHHGMPRGHLPVCSYLAVPVISRTGEAIGGLFFGHPEPNVFSERSERLIVGIAAQAAIAIDNARLYDAAQREIAQRRIVEARLRVSLEASALGTWDYNPVTATMSLDPRCQELFGLPGRETIDLTTFLDLAHPADRARRERAVRASLETGAPYEIEYRTAGTSLRWLRAAGRSVAQVRGGPEHLVTAVADITDLVKARESLEERGRELEKLVNARTASLQEAVGQMEEFSYSVSHDLRAPLRAIHGYAEAITEDHAQALDPVAKDYLARIASAASRMDRLTLDVLTYSKISRDAMRVERVSLDKIVSETIEQYVSSALQPQITVQHPLLDVEGHEPLLVQAVSNLITNALKFVRPGQVPEIQVRTERLANDVRLWIEDNGIGIPPENQSRIWGLFERIHPRALYDGTGVGLAVVRKAVERMGGKVGVVSDGKQGSKFWIQLPCFNKSE